MIACTDVYYRATHAIAACLLFRDWPNDCSYFELTNCVEKPAAYEPGRFYRRELPALLSVVEKLPERPDVIMIDGYVWLGQESYPGLGAYLYEALGGTSAVIGVAKKLFKEGTAVRGIRRGKSVRPL